VKPDPQCRICGDAYNTIRVCDACKADPANVDWIEPDTFRGKFVEPLIKDIARALHAYSIDDGARRSRGVHDHQHDDGPRGSSAAAPMADVHLDPTEGCGSRETPVRKMIAIYLDAERETGCHISNKRIAEKARCSEEYVAKVRREFRRDPRSLRRAALARRRPRRDHDGEAAFTELITAAWREYKTASPWAERGDGVGHYGHCGHTWLPVDPPGWFIRHELGFSVEEFERSLMETCRTLAATNRRRIETLRRTGEGAPLNFEVPLNREQFGAASKKSGKTEPTSSHGGKAASRSTASPALFRAAR
jgi:hypothetical protein